MIVKTRPIDIEQFEQMPEFDGPYELIDGSVVEKMAGDQHSRIARRLEKAIMVFDPNDKWGLTWRDATVKVVGDDGNGRKPDLAYIIASRVPAESPGSLTVMPDLVVEVWSFSDTDGPVSLKSTRIKMLYWPSNGAKITWCINPVAQEVEVYYAGQNAPAKVLTLNAELDGEEVIPGFKLPIASLFGT